MSGELLAGHELRPEHELLLLCARTRVDEAARSRMRSLLDQPLNWAWVLGHASRHGTVALLHRHLREISGTADGLVPEPVLAKLQDVSIRRTARSLLLIGELKSVLADLEAAEARVAVWKGPVLAYSVYPSPELRTFVDLDLLVRRRDVQRTREVLLARGYAPKASELPEEHQFSRGSHSVSMVNERTGISVDLHWGAAARYFSSAMDTDILCEQAQPLAVGDATIPALPPAPLLLALSAHGAKHGPFPWPMLKWITDVEAFLWTYPDKDWAAVLARARATGCQRMVLLGICLARALLDAPIPPVVDAAIRDDPVVTRLVPGIRDRLLSENAQGFAFRDRVHFDLAVRERLRDRIRYRYERLLTISPRDLAALRLPTRLRFLQLPLRLTRLAGSYVLRPSRIRHLYLGTKVPSGRSTDSSHKQS
jgi:hypothetical protein